MGEMGTHVMSMIVTFYTYISNKSMLVNFIDRERSLHVSTVSRGFDATRSLTKKESKT